jgi:hypothetical protein
LELNLWGVSDAVSAGLHTVAVKSDCTGGNFNTATLSRDGAVGGLLVGS